MITKTIFYLVQHSDKLMHQNPKQFLTADTLQPGVFSSGNRGIVSMCNMEQLKLGGAFPFLIKMNIHAITVNSINIYWSLLLITLQQYN